MDRHSMDAIILGNCTHFRDSHPPLPVDIHSGHNTPHCDPRAGIGAGIILRPWGLTKYFFQENFAGPLEVTQSWVVWFCIFQNKVARTYVKFLLSVMVWVARVARIKPARLKLSTLVSQNIKGFRCTRLGMRQTPQQSAEMKPNWKMIKFGWQMI